MNLYGKVKPFCKRTIALYIQIRKWNAASYAWHNENILSDFTAKYEVERQKPNTSPIQIMISRERDLQILHFLDSILCVCSVISNKIHPGDEIPDATRHKTRKKGAIGNYL